MWFLFGEVSPSSGCLGWAALFYCGTPLAFHIIILYESKGVRMMLMLWRKCSAMPGQDSFSEEISTLRLVL